MSTKPVERDLRGKTVRIRIPKVTADVSPDAERYVDRASGMVTYSWGNFTVFDDPSDDMPSRYDVMEVLGDI